MFSYVDQRIRQWLRDSGKLVTLDDQGRPVPPGAPDGRVLSVLGPIPLAHRHRNREVPLRWYPFVRRIELERVLDAAAEVPRGGEERFRELLCQNMSVNSLLATEGFLEQPAPLVRLHSCCMTGDVFGSMRCECGPQLQAAFDRVLEQQGAVVYMSSHEGRGIGLWAKAITYLLQDSGQDTYEANVSLGLPEDSRDFGDAALVLRHLLGGKPIRLLSNNPMKREHLERAGQPVAEMVPLVTGLSPHNERYMRAKRRKGHKLPEVP
ncbi:MAG: GTP cyclohydrolase II [Deltaproteobacteria bacterium]|nr:GTP cyclohydrolase II [Deltaproteobacteria bacterium]